MGQTASSSPQTPTSSNSPSHQPEPRCTAGGSGGERLIFDVVEALGHGIRKQTTMLTELNTLSYEQFRASVNELNELSRRCPDAAGHRLLFVVRRDTDQTLLWKATVRIGCVRVDSLTNRVRAHKTLNLAQFVRVHRTFQAHVRALESSSVQRAAAAVASSSSSKTDASLDGMGESSVDDSDCDLGVALSSSLLDDVNRQQQRQHKPQVECIICMDRRADVSLPCAHDYCYPCIEQWKDQHSTCPVCQAVLSDADDSWVLTEPPDVDEVSDRICSDLMKLSMGGDCAPDTTHSDALPSATTTTQ